MLINDFVDRLPFPQIITQKTLPTPLNTFAKEEMRVIEKINNLYGDYKSLILPSFALPDTLKCLAK